MWFDIISLRRITKKLKNIIEIRKKLVAIWPLGS